MTNHLFKEIAPEEIDGNVFRMIDKQWFLLTAGNLGHYNTMTASWGGLGILWNKPVAFCFVRPTRFTYQFMEETEYFSMSFLDKEYRKALNFCGKHSGRDVNKMDASGLSPLNTDKGTIFVEQASLVLECRKLYFSDLKPEHFLDKSTINNYPNADYHRMYVGEIVKCLQNQHNGL